VIGETSEFTHVTHCGARILKRTIVPPANAAQAATTNQLLATPNRSTTKDIINGCIVNPREAASPFPALTDPM
jgi:hypothetical protein